ncbi:hypothetical protein NL676_008023 [Syzygium grande]|nr:hypothetical protein NL676_008023 [Syzygium grande]
MKKFCIQHEARPSRHLCFRDGAAATTDWRHHHQLPQPWPLQLPGIFKLAAVATLSNLAMAARVFKHHFVDVNLEDGGNEDVAMGGSKLGDSVVGGAVAESRRRW